ncbi:hypothetical protein [Nocardia noduli]|uniref:hypothetical protein n=1 Tax=Nocardia noduli TaxID=2815722 RepID=UPI001C23C857|nr:hypothetical protein [Nocardia noduli]
MTAENAWSALWGSERSTDGTRTRCPCDGDFDYEPCPDCQADEHDWDLDRTECARCEDGGVIATCPLCGTTGWQDCARGYSCWPTPAQLITYISERVGHMVDDVGTVVEFDGDIIDVGFDGEPLVVPTRIIRTSRWSEFLARHPKRIDIPPALSA